MCRAWPRQMRWGRVGPQGGAPAVPQHRCQCPGAAVASRRAGTQAGRVTSLRGDGACKKLPATHCLCVQCTRQEHMPCRPTHSPAAGRPGHHPRLPPAPSARRPAQARPEAPAERRPTGPRQQPAAAGSCAAATPAGREARARLPPQSPAPQRGTQRAPSPHPPSQLPTMPAPAPAAASAAAARPPGVAAGAAAGATAAPPATTSPCRWPALPSRRWGQRAGAGPCTSLWGTSAAATPCRAAGQEGRQ